MQNVTYFACPRLYRNSLPAMPTVQTVVLRAGFDGREQTRQILKVFSRISLNVRYLYLLVATIRIGAAGYS